MKILKPLYPPAAIEAWYRKKLTDAIAEMNNSVQYWIRAGYRQREDEIVFTADASPARAMEARLDKVMRKWLRDFDHIGDTLTKRFISKLTAYEKRQFEQALKSSGFTVKFRMTRELNDIYQASLIENVNLIKTIPRQYLDQVRGHVMRSISAGRDQAYLADAIEQEYGKTRRRAIMIARDQTQKVTNALDRGRCNQLGVTQGIWIHTSGAKVPRETHVAFNGKVFDLAVGLYDSDVGREVLPGECVNCRCRFRPIVPEIGDDEEGGKQLRIESLLTP